MSMTPPILMLPPELLPLITSHIPLQRFPSTLLSLLLTTRQIYGHVRALLYSKVVIKNEETALLMLEKLMGDIHLGALVRELHILTDFSPKLCDARGGTTVITELQQRHQSRTHTPSTCS